MKLFSTPMMRQYQEIKKNYTDCLLFYRMGDFFELFLEDALIGSQILNITLTSKAGGKDGRIPMAGIPYHAVDSYIAKLIQAGHKVAICEQLSPPNKKGLVKRDVVRVVTPGTVLDEKTLEGKSNNYIISVSQGEDILGISIADLSTGYFATAEVEKDSHTWLINELAKLSPSECILSPSLYNDPEILGLLKQQSGMNIYCFHQWDTYANQAQRTLETHFHVKTLEGFGISEKQHACKASAALLGYLQETQKSHVLHIQNLHSYETDNHMLLDKSTMINLELFSTIREKDTRGSLLSILDETKTAMGARLLKEWIKKPLIEKQEILLRQEAVEELVGNNKKRKELQEKCSTVHDIERLLSRLSVGIGSPRDLVNLKNSLRAVIQVQKLLFDTTSPFFKHLQKAIHPHITHIIELIEKTIVEDPPFDPKQGGVIQKGVNKQLDILTQTIAKSNEWIKNLEKKEKEKTGIATLKIRFNQVFGFYIEISKASVHLAPAHYMRKQTLVNGERFITPELKKHEEIILSSQEKGNELEYQIFLDILAQVLSHVESIQQAAHATAQLDCIANFAHISKKYRYCKPLSLYSGEFRITKARHPVVEQLLPSTQQFVPNDVCLDNVSQSLLLITGPNMAGKSVFIRQVAIIALMNQIGCFVPAQSAHISIVDRIFVRSGASDVITSGLSTFMVEMVETAQILRSATEKSLIVMDEIGRGTSTYDGISIAWAVAEFLVTNFTSPPKTLFATHYHELQSLEQEYPQSIKNFHMAVTNDQGQPVFLHTLLAQGASHSFGVAVAKLAGIPKEVIEKAEEMLIRLEKRNTNSKDAEPIVTTLSQQQSLAMQLIQKELEKLDIAHMTPMEAINKLAELKDHFSLLANPQEFLEAD